MGRMMKSCLQSVLKLVNSVMGFVGVAMILYSLWMVRVWCRQGHGFWPLSDDPIHPWFIYTFLGVGFSLCLITFSGHIAAETAYGHCLSCAAITADVFLNRNWEEDFPEDPTGKFSDLKHFIKSNFDICKWIGLAVVAAQAMSIFLAMVLRALGPHNGSYYDSDDDYTPERLPLLRNQAQPNPYIVDPHAPYKSDPWTVR